MKLMDTMGNPCFLKIHLFHMIECVIGPLILSRQIQIIMALASISFFFLVPFHKSPYMILI